MLCKNVCIIIFITDQAQWKNNCNHIYRKYLLCIRTAKICGIWQPNESSFPVYCYSATTKENWSVIVLFALLWLASSDCSSVIVLFSLLWLTSSDCSSVIVLFALLWLTITEEQSEDVNQRRANNTITKRKKDHKQWSTTHYTEN
jgi:hypothetical protein